MTIIRKFQLIQVERVPPRRLVRSFCFFPPHAHPLNSLSKITRLSLIPRYYSEQRFAANFETKLVLIYLCSASRQVLRESITKVRSRFGRQVSCPSLLRLGKHSRNRPTTQKFHQIEHGNRRYHPTIPLRITQKL